ncbi:MAG: hypothetical protein JXB49_29700 [Bacteroidales bacterium]|nr:hypothetical protein [Bacteroidales bacterium]
MNNNTYINSYGRKVLEYVPPVSIMLDLPHILTRDKILRLNMPYLKLEKKIAGNDIAAIRLIDFEDEDGIVTLYVQELESKRTYYLSANMEYDDMWFWSLTDLPTLYNLSK